jgi:hypothetical protein
MEQVVQVAAQKAQENEASAAELRQQSQGVEGIVERLSTIIGG